MEGERESNESLVQMEPQSARREEGAIEGKRRESEALTLARHTTVRGRPLLCRRRVVRREMEGGWGGVEEERKE